MVQNVIRQPTQKDIDHISQNARREDIEELDALDGTNVADALASTPYLFENSQVWEVEGKPICIFGVNPLEQFNSVGVIWLLATEDFQKYARLFAVKCKNVTNQMIENYDYVFNYVHAENEVSIKWLQWLGFTVHDPEPLGKDGANFHRFDIDKNV
jgi:hypothetical protein